MSLQVGVSAVSENAAEACASKCSPADADQKLFLADAPDVKAKQDYDACYSKCVAQETKEVVEEREKVSLCRKLVDIRCYLEGSACICTQVSAQSNICNEAFASVLPDCTCPWRGLSLFIHR